MRRINSFSKATLYLRQWIVAHGVIKPSASGPAHDEMKRPSRTEIWPRILRRNTAGTRAYYLSVPILMGQMPLKSDHSPWMLAPNSPSHSVLIFPIRS